MLYLILIIIIFNSDNYHAIFKSENCHAIFNFDNYHAIFIPDNCHAIFDFNNYHAMFDTSISYAIFDTGIYHAIVDTDICHATLDPWRLTPTLGMLYWYVNHDSGTWYLHRHSIYGPGTWYDILDTCIWHLVYDMPSCGTNTWTWHLDPWPDITTPDTCIYMAYSWLLLLRGHDMIIILLLPDIWYSWTPVLLYTWTPEIGMLLTLPLILYSCWPP